MSLHAKNLGMGSGQGFQPESCLAARTRLPLDVPVSGFGTTYRSPQFLPSDPPV